MHEFMGSRLDCYEYTGVPNNDSNIPSFSFSCYLSLGSGLGKGGAARLQDVHTYKYMCICKYIPHRTEAVVTTVGRLPDWEMLLLLRSCLPNTFH